MQESGEMYLETIFVLKNKGILVRSVDIAEYMNYSKPSVSRAVGILKKQNFIIIDENGLIELTEKGKSVAEKIYERHTILTHYLISIGVSEKTAQDDACKIEHAISDESFFALKNHFTKNHL